MTTLPATHEWSAREARNWRSLLWGVWAVLLVAGLFGVVQRFAQGHLPAGYGSYVPWGLWVALYFHGVGIAGGAFIVGALAFILDWPGFLRPQVLRTVIVLSLASILPAFVGVWLDLGHMERAQRIFTAPSFTSMMAFNAWMYMAFGIVAVVAWFLSFRRDSEWLKPLLCLGIFFSFLFPSQSGAFFGVVDAKPYWHNALLPVLFLTSAITAGSAMLLVVIPLVQVAAKRPDRETANDSGSMLGRLRVVVLTALLFYLFFEFAEFSISLWSPAAQAPAVELVLWGPYWWVFWIIHLLLGAVVPLVLLTRRQPAAWAVAAFLLAVTLVSTRLNVLIPGQAIGEIHGLQDAFIDQRLNYIYHATPMEYLVGLFLVAFGMVIFVAGRQLGAMAASRYSSTARAEES